MIIRRCRSRWIEELPQSPWRWLLLPGWCLFAGAAQLRRLAYDLRLLPIHRARIAVISVGNLVAGGAGKTPAAIAIAHAARAAGHTPMIVSRGYRSGADGRNEEAHLAGDIPVLCDRDRVRGVATAAQRGATIAILDDGFQHRRLHRDADVVVIDATRPFGDDAGGEGWMLPLGLRREPLAALRRASALWISRCDLVDAPRLTRLLELLATLRIPVWCEQTMAAGVATADVQRPWLLVSGIGNAAAFETQAQRIGHQVRESWRYPDHHHYSDSDAAAIMRRADVLQAQIITTSKDAVKLRALIRNLQVLEVTASVRASDRVELNALLARLPPHRHA